MASTLSPSADRTGRGPRMLRASSRARSGSSVQSPAARHSHTGGSIGSPWFVERAERCAVRPVSEARSRAPPRSRFGDERWRRSRAAVRAGEVARP